MSIYFKFRKLRLYLPGAFRQTFLFLRFLRPFLGPLRVVLNKITLHLQHLYGILQALAHAVQLVCDYLQLIRGPDSDRPGKVSSSYAFQFILQSIERSRYFMCREQRYDYRRYRGEESDYQQNLYDDGKYEIRGRLDYHSQVLKSDCGSLAIEIVD